MPLPTHWHTQHLVQGTKHWGLSTPILFPLPSLPYCSFRFQDLPSVSRLFFLLTPPRNVFLNPARRSREHCKPQQRSLGRASAATEFLWPFAPMKPVWWQLITTQQQECIFTWREGPTLQVTPYSVSVADTWMESMCYTRHLVQRNFRVFYWWDKLWPLNLTCILINSA